MVEENITEEIKQGEKKVEKSKVTADLSADIYAFFPTSSTGALVGNLNVNSKTLEYALEGENFNWDEFIKIFKETMTKELVKDIIENPQVLRIPVGEQYEGIKNYYRVNRLEKK